MITGIAMIIFGWKIPEFSVFIILGILKFAFELLEVILRIIRVTANDKKAEAEKGRK